MSNLKYTIMINRKWPWVISNVSNNIIFMIQHNIFIYIDIRIPEKTFE